MMVMMVCGAERGIEHHELVCQVYNVWTPADEGRFYFRKDFAKYELFRNPTVSATFARCQCDFRFDLFFSFSFSFPVIF